MKAAILEKLNEPLAIRDLPVVFGNGRVFDNQVECGYGQVLVRVLVAGICGAQLQEIRGDKGDPAHLPHLLGHEGCGAVEQIGPGVRYVKPGDKVVMHWRKGNGCDADGGIFRFNPSTLQPFNEIKSGPLTCFSEYTIVSENRVTPVPQDFPDDLACLLGCSLSTALGVIENEARVKFGESVMIVGCGGVGLALILAARLAHAFPIAGIDKSPDKLELVESLGAEFWPESYHHGYDVIIDTTGICPYTEDLGPSGRYIMVGQPNHSSFLHLTSSFFSGNGQRIQATQGGCFSPSIDIPRYVNLWRSGALDGWENLITHRVSLDDINKGLDLVREGKAGRVLVDMAAKNAIDYSCANWTGCGLVDMNLSGGLSGGNDVADVIPSKPLAHSLPL